MKTKTALPLVPLFLVLAECSNTGTTAPKVPASTPATEASTALFNDIEFVKNGVLRSLHKHSVLYDSTTVGKAFERKFVNPKWSTLETSKGLTVVVFEGGSTHSIVSPEIKLNEATEQWEWYEKYSACIADDWSAANKAECVKRVPVPVLFQFTVAADKRGFDLSYMNLGSYDGSGVGRISKVLDFIYQ